MKNRDDEGSPDDRPHDRKRLAAQLEREGLGETKLTRDPRSEEGRPPRELCRGRPQMNAMTISTMSAGHVNDMCWKLLARFLFVSPGAVEPKPLEGFGPE